MLLSILIKSIRLEDLSIKHFSCFYVLYWRTRNMKVEDIDRVIEMAWEDRTPFEAIQIQCELSESEVIALMRRELKRSSFNLWRKRVNSGVSMKHLAKRPEEVDRFKCTRQRAISMNKVSKR